ncbi:hypothetical protein [Streptomyces sp. PD-S100-1]|uniref:hypothetical protein n=1 Tax=Streptomyces sp. PD-S100-1 TaxID=3394351 RepID=UPI0039BD544B
MASYVLYEAVCLIWSSVLPGGGDRTLLSLVVFVAMITGTLLLLFAEFDGKTPRPPYATAPAPQPCPPYGSPYGG